MRLELAPFYPSPVYGPAPEVAVQSSTAGPLCEIQTGPTDYLLIVGLWFSFNPRIGTVGTLINIGFGQPAARGIGIFGTSPINADGGNTNSSSGVKVYSQWTRQPTAPANFLRRMTYNSPVSAAVKIPFRFPRGVKLQPSSSWVLWMLAGTGLASNTFMGLDLMLDG